MEGGKLVWVGLMMGLEATIHAWQRKDIMARRVRSCKGRQDKRRIDSSLADSLWAIKKKKNKEAVVAVAQSS